MATEVVYCGHKNTAEGVTPVEANMQVIIEAPNLENTSQLKPYLGIVNYYHKFLPQLSTVLVPLHQLLIKNELWSWSSGQEQAFHKPKELLTSTKLLVHYDSMEEIASRCIQRLSAYEYTMQHKKGCNMSNADTLSGIPLKVSSTPVPISGKIIQLANLLEATPVDRKNIKSWTQ